MPSQCTVLYTRIDIPEFLDELASLDFKLSVSGSGMFLQLAHLRVFQSYLWRWIFNAGLEISPGSCRNAVDVDGDGQITKEEFVEKGFLINSPFLCFPPKKYIHLITGLSTQQPENQNIWMFQSKQTDTNMLLTNDD